MADTKSMYRIFIVEDDEIIARTVKKPSGNDVGRIEKEYDIPLEEDLNFLIQKKKQKFFFYLFFYPFDSRKILS